MQPKNLLTLTSPIGLGNDNGDINSNENIPLTLTNGDYDQVMDILHGKKLQRKISTDYVKIIEQTEHARRNYAKSLRSFEYAKTRPFLTVSQYQERNQEYQKKHSKENNKVETISPNKKLSQISSAISEAEQIRYSLEVIEP